MGRLIYAALMSVDGYIEDAAGRFDWAEPDAEVHSYINDLERSIGTHLYGRRMYETMMVWETVGDDAEVGPIEAAYGRVWRELDKVVFSRTLAAVPTPRTRLEREFDPDSVRQMKEVSDHDLSISGPNLAAHAFAANLIDEVQLFVFPVIVGGGKAALPGGVQLPLRLLGERRFDNGAVHLRYATAAAASVPEGD
jgi:dihydrofolate reductase